VNVRDWREADSAVLAPLYEHGRRRWAAALGWDTSQTWRTIEQARTTWGLPGLLAQDDSGRVRGWTFFLPQHNRLQVGGLAAETPAATGVLLDSLLAVSSDAGAEGVSCFVFDEAPNLGGELQRRGFETESFLYLVRDLGGAEQPLAAAGDAWQPEHSAAAAALLHAAYDAASARHLAPGHTLAAWEQYVRNLLEQTGLGTFNAGASRVIHGGGALDALVLVTALSPETAHLAQVAVRPSRRGGGVARRLVTEACARAAAQGYTRATLLVGASNAAARRLYASLGFVPGSQFIAAHR
jgi:ribosomal protein S18 acetylase RimI-like enzyme